MESEFFLTEMASSIPLRMPVTVTVSRLPALLHLHNFPLDHGGKGEVDCKVCHTGSYAQNTCYSCHDHQVEAIRTSHAKVSLPKDVTLEQCTACHLNGKVNK